MGAEAVVNAFGTRDELLDLPVFLTNLEYVDAPRESTYQAAFADVPEFWQRALEVTADA